MKSATKGNRIFATNPRITRPRSTFVRPSDIKTTMYSGYLVPVYNDEVLPGDTMNLNMTIFGRVATPIVPIMDNAYLETFWFYCPNRILWTNFVKQMGEQDNPGDSINYLTPVITYDHAQATVHSLWDYFELPCSVAAPATAPVVTSLLFRMYNKVWNEWFRDQDLQNSLTVPTGDGPDTHSTFTLMRINKYHDYFTSCRPSPQKGTAPTLSLGGSAAITGTGDVWGSTSALGSSYTINNAPWMTAYADTNATDRVYRSKMQLPAQAGGGALATLPQTLNMSTTSTAGSGTATAGTPDVGFLNKTLSQAAQPSAVAPFALDLATVQADLSTSTGITLNTFRQFVSVQRILEADARGGTRYNEGIFTHFGVINPDNRVNKTLFLGSGKSFINIAQVPQTSESATTPQGNLAAFGTVSSHTNGFFQSFNEHGWILGLAVVRGDLHYQNMLEKKHTRRTRYDYYTPEFATLGEQAVLSSEIQFTGVAATDALVFGYQERWAELRYKNSSVTGLMRSVWPTTLDVWHLAQEFAGAPTLGNTFIQEDAPWDRVVAVTSEPTFIINGYTRNQTTRVMPVRSIPGLFRI